MKFVTELYQAGALEVILPDIYRNQRGDQFADGMLVKLPKGAKQRKAIRAVCAALQKKNLCALFRRTGTPAKATCIYCWPDWMTRQSRVTSTLSAPQAGRPASRHSATASPTCFSTASRIGRAPSFG
jgi:hypothetical protein